MSGRPAIGLVDYGMGNRRSVEKALEHVGAEVNLSAEAEALAASDGLVVPGVGAFPAGMRSLRQLGLDEVIRRRGQEGTPILGICLGMQLLFEDSDEVEPTAGLGLIPGEVRRLEAGGLRLPHIGWNEVRFEQSSPLTASLAPGGCPFYHVHSFAARPGRREDVLATAEYGQRFATIVGHGRVFGVQFHPEKSSRDGLRLLENFVAYCARLAAPAASAA